MAPATTVKLRFLSPVKFGFKEDTPGFEARQLGDEYVYTVKSFDVGDEFEFPANEAEAVRGLVEDGYAIRVGAPAKAAPADDSK